jgi:hypothetical protein
VFRKSERRELNRMLGKLTPSDVLDGDSASTESRF